MGKQKLIAVVLSVAMLWSMNGIEMSAKTVKVQTINQPKESHQRIQLETGMQENVANETNSKVLSVPVTERKKSGESVTRKLEMTADSTGAETREVAGVLSSIDESRWVMVIGDTEFKMEENLVISSDIVQLWIDHKYVVATLVNNMVTKLRECNEMQDGGMSSITKTDEVEDAAYGVVVRQSSKEGNIVTMARDLENSMNQYIDAIADSMGKSVKISDRKTEAQRLREADEATNDKAITMPAGAPEEVINSAYKAYALYLDTYVQEGINLGKIDLGKST